MSRFSRKKGLSKRVVYVGSKLRALEVSTPALSKGDLDTSNSENDQYSVKRKEKGNGVYAKVVRMKTDELGDSLWVHVGDRGLLSREEQLSRCLVGCFGDSFEFVPPLSFLKKWAYEIWSLGRGLKIFRLGGALVLFEFKNKVETNLVLLRGSKVFKEKEFLLHKWGPKVGCFRNESHAKEVWVKVVRLPLHLWSREVFKSIGERCGGFIVIDEETTFFSQLQWSRILV